MGAFKDGTNNQLTSCTLIDDDLKLDASHNGQMIIVKEFADHVKLTLPPVQAGYAVKVMILHNQNTTDKNFVVQAKVDTTFIYGLFSRIAAGGGSSTAWDTSPASYAGATAATFTGGGGTVAVNNTITITKMVQGSFFELFCDGTHWYVYGILQSAQGANDATVTFSAEDY